MNPVTMNVPEPGVRAEARAEAPANAAADSTTPVPEASPQTSPQAKAVRGENGRWLQGNPGGAGNPFARQVAAVRQRLYDRITPDMMDELIDTLVELARRGNVQALKLILQYMAGKPTTPSNPDALDIEEWEHYKKSVPMMSEMPNLYKTFTPDYLTARIRDSRPDINRALNAELAHALRHPEESLAPGLGLGPGHGEIRNPKLEIRNKFKGQNPKRRQRDRLKHRHDGS